VSELRFHLDEDAESHALVQALRSRGVDVSTTGEAGLTELSDPDQLAWSTRERRALLTYNAADFCQLHAQFSQSGQNHGGIVIAEQQRHPVGEMMRRILRLRATLSAEDMRARLEFLNRW
jgi:hypothetical protein